jgi:glycolate oxidase
MEFLDNLTIRAVEEVHKKGLPVDAGAILITDVDGNLEEDLELQMGALERVFKANGCSDFVRAKDATEASNLWFARRNFVRN